MLSWASRHRRRTNARVGRRSELSHGPRHSAARASRSKSKRHLIGHCVLIFGVCPLAFSVAASGPEDRVTTVGQRRPVRQQTPTRPPLSQPRPGEPHAPSLPSILPSRRRRTVLGGRRTRLCVHRGRAQRMGPARGDPSLEPVPRHRGPWSHFASAVPAHGLNAARQRSEGHRSA